MQNIHINKLFECHSHECKLGVGWGKQNKLNVQPVMPVKLTSSVSRCPVKAVKPKVRVQGI